MNVFFAKPDQTYAEHVEYVYTAWKQTIAAKQHFLQRVAERWNLDYQDLVHASLFAIAFHDIGKMIVPFQEMMAALQTNTPFDVRHNYRHELVSFLYASYHLRKLPRSTYVPLILLGAMAIAGHHRALNSDLTSFEREEKSAPPVHIRAGIDEAFRMAETIFRREGWSFTPSFDDKVLLANPYWTLADLIPRLPMWVEREGQEQSRAIYSILKGILHYSDWHGSGMVSVNYATETNSEHFIQHLIDRCHQKGILYEGLKPFQQACNDRDGDLLLIAPTGSGKTEAAILWALTNLHIMQGAKILYLLPTMVTANSIWQRLAEVFGRDNVGLTHSTANLCRQADAREFGEEEQWENRRTYLFDQTFMKPITVATVDQLLTIGFNSGKWTIKEINASNAVIIIDEIHAYDDWTLGLIVSAIRHFSAFGARFLLMSATLPTYIHSLLAKELPNAATIADVTLANEIRSTYFVKDTYIEEDLNTIASAVLEGKRTLVVVNTVSQCQSMAEKLKDLEPLCYHSHFILKDRKRIEEKIPQVKLLVATQVVEVSLDIDFDWLFTECAPADAIAQRAGRVNRYRDKERDSRVIVYKASRTSELIYDPLNNISLLEATYGAFDSTIEQKGHGITETDLLNIVKTVYSTYNIEASDIFIDATQQYNVSQRRRIAIFDSRLGEDKEEVTRRSTYETVSVIPLCFKEEAMQSPPAERRWYEVKLPLWYVQKYGREIEGIMFCDVLYDDRLGAQLKDESQ